MCSLPECFAVRPINFFWTLVQLAQRRSLGFAEMEGESEVSTMCIARMTAAQLRRTVGDAYLPNPSTAHHGGV